MPLTLHLDAQRTHEQIAFLRETLTNPRLRPHPRYLVLKLVETLEGLSRTLEDNDGALCLDAQLISKQILLLRGALANQKLPAHQKFLVVDLTKTLKLLSSMIESKETIFVCADEAIPRAA